MTTPNTDAASPQNIKESAVPAWILENLPPYLKTRPATTEALWAFCVTTIPVVVGIALGLVIDAARKGADTSFGATVQYMLANWWPYTIGQLIVPAVAAKVAHSKAKTS